MKKDITIVGAGLCGSMLAVKMAKMGYTVQVFEKRSDLRKTEISAGRSINLALSSRGMAALAKIGLADQAAKLCIPMYGRMIHGVDGSQSFYSYSGRKDEYINSVSRGGLNALLLDAADKEQRISLHFEHACTGVSYQSNHCSFSHHDQKVEVDSDAIFGTDGAGSEVRKAMMARTPDLLFNYSQDFLRHGYKELSIPPDEHGNHRIDKHALHIWPRGSFMIIALPNLDGSFTVTMFHPYGGELGFDDLTTSDKVQQLFETYFPDLLDLIPDISAEYFSNPVSNLGTIKCYPWYAGPSTLLMGDAAHAIVPFYGQGMNASFEDVAVWSDILEKHKFDMSSAMHQFAEIRKKDADAIADLAIDNFYEMRDHVANPIFTEKRKLELALEQNIPTYYSKYAMVTFRPDLPYSEAMRLGRKQDEILLELCKTGRHQSMELGEVYQFLTAELQK